MTPAKGDRLPVWALVKALDMPETKVVRLIDDLGLPFVTIGDGSYTSRSAFRSVVLSAAASR